MWNVHYDERLDGWLNELPPDMKAKVLRIVDLLVTYGPQNVREPCVKHVEGHRKFFEMRARGKDALARVFYFTMTGQRLFLLHGFIKKTSATPKREIEIALQRMSEAMHG